MPGRTNDAVIMKRISVLEDGHESLEAGLASLESRHDSLVGELRNSTVIIKQISDDTSELLELFGNVKGGIKTAYWVGNAVKWILGITVSFIGAYLAIKHWINGG